MRIDFLQNLTRYTRKKSKNRGREEERNYSYSILNERPYGQSYDPVWLGESNKDDSEELTYEACREILKDTQVSIAIDFIIDFLLTRDFVITPVDDSPEQAEIVEFLEDMINSLDVPFRQVRKDMYRSIIYSFVVFEKVFEYYNGKIRYKALYPLHPSTLEKEPFKFDDKGNLTHIHQTSPYGEVDLEINKVLLYSYNAEFDEIKGHSPLENLRQAVRDRQLMIKSMVNFIRKHERPVLYAKLENSNNASKIRRMLSRVRDDNKNITVGAEEELGILESQHHGEAYFKAINYFDRIIFRRCGIGNLLFGEDGQTGSYSQSKIQIEVSTSKLNGLHEDVALRLQNEFIDPVVKLNWGDDNPIPRASFNGFVEDDIINLLRELKPYVDNMTIDSQEDWLQRLIALAVEQVTGLEVNNTTDKLVEDLLTQHVYMEDLPGKEEADKSLEPLLIGDYTDDLTDQLRQMDKTKQG